MKEFSVNGLRVTYEEANAEKKPTLLFIHGNSHASSSFAKQATCEDLKNFRMIFINLPGHGDSDRSAEYTLPFFAETISAIVEHLELKNFMLVGHSLGGHIAIHSLGHLSPAGVFIFGTPPLTKPLDFSGFLPNAKARALSQDICTDEDIEDFLSELNYSGADRAHALANFKKTDPTVRTKVLQSVGGNQYFDESELIKQFTGKLMVLVSEKENLVNNNYIKQLLAQIDADVKLGHIQAGHVPQVEKHAEFNEILAEFCQEVFATEHWQARAINHQGHQVGVPFN